ncbi:retinol-binding protein pinta-like [Periplaneta americana]|uniref:retinol-binding protein pinta-like n=1 Tax=Periplaneta americana TaxID=6978 RepID=UPI0037E73783
MAVRPLSPELEEIARRELNEDPSRAEQDIKHLKDWLAKQPHISSRQDKQWLTMFLRGCKFSLERTKAKLDMYYTLKTALPEFYTRRDPMLPENQELLKLGAILPLPLPDDQGRRVILMRNGLNDPEKFKLVDMFRINIMIIDVLLEEDDRSTICGTVIVLDHSRSTLTHFTQFTPSLIKRGTTLFQEGYPMRPKGLHHITTNSAFTTIFNMLKSFMKDKMKNRLFVHAALDSLHEHVPKRILPKEYGGEAGSLSEITEEWKKKVEAKRSWLLEQEKYGVDEKKRPGGRPKTQEDLFGLQGSFRQLNVD